MQTKIGDIVGNPVNLRWLNTLDRSGGLLKNRRLEKKLSWWINSWRFLQFLQTRYQAGMIFLSEVLVLWCKMLIAPDRCKGFPLCASQRYYSFRLHKARTSPWVHAQNKYTWPYSRMKVVAKSCNRSVMDFTDFFFILFRLCIKTVPSQSHTLYNVFLH